MNEKYIGKLFTLKDHNQFWVLEGTIFRQGLEIHHIITLKDEEYWPMKLLSIKNTCYFKHANETYSQCNDQELTSLRLFTPSRLDLIL